MSIKPPHTALVFSRLEDLNRGLVEALETGVESLDASVWIPRVDVIETAESIFVLAEVPGLSKERLEVEIEGRTVTIAGSKEVESPDEPGARFACMERARGQFVRRIRLQHLVDSHAGAARLGHGVLEIEFPRITEQRNRAIKLPIEGVED